MKKPAPAPGTIENGHRFGGGDPADPNSWTPLHGDDFLKTLPPNKATLVQMLADGRQPFPTGKAAAAPYWQDMLQSTAQYDPTFDAVDFGARAATRKRFTAGPDADNVAALNTAIGHLTRLHEAIGKLGNYDAGELGPLTKWNNQAAKWIAEHSGTDARFARFNEDKEALAGEKTKVFRGGMGAEGDIQREIANMDPTSSPTTLYAAANEAAHLMKSKLDALNTKYQQGMGPARNVREFMSPENLTAFDRMLSTTGGAPAPAKPAASAIRYLGTE